MADIDSIRRAHNFKDITGRRFGSLVVTGYGEKQLAVGWSVENALTTSVGTDLITHDGESLSIRGWAKKLGISHSGVCYRLKQGWSIKQIVEHYRA